MMISVNALIVFFLTINELFQLMNDDRTMMSMNNSRELAIKIESPFDISMSPIFGYFLMRQFFYGLLTCLFAMVNALLVSLVNLFCENW